MRYNTLAMLTLTAMAFTSCTMYMPPDFKKGTFAYDQSFLEKHDTTLVILRNNDSTGQLIISPKYQAKVFTSTANGGAGHSFGWVNYKEFDLKTPDEHMNGFGGEDRLWLGPEGSKFALFFKPGTAMTFDNWHTPAAIDREPWKLDSATAKKATLSKTTTMQNYGGTQLNIRLDRSIQVLENTDIQTMLGIAADTAVKAVAFTTVNSITNTGTTAWDKTTGAPCLWNLDMFSPSPAIVIVVPYETATTGKIATTDYFGQIPPDRVKTINGTLYFKADGKSRGKLGVPVNRIKKYAGSYDATNNVLTLITYDFDTKATYLNQEWKTDKDPYIGDAVNAYNDGPLANGTQMGPFYEIESVSPAAFLKPNEKLTHKHSVFHFTGNKEALNAIALKTLGVSLQTIQASF